MSGLVLALDPERILLGLAGDHAGEVCIREDDNTVRLATEAEIKLGLLVNPLLRRWWEAKDRLPYLPKGRGR